MEQHALLSSKCSDFLNGLQRADLVIRVHDADERRRAVDGLAHRGRIDLAMAIHRQHGDTTAPAFQELAGLQGGRVLHRTGDDVGALPPPVRTARQTGENRAENGVIARLGAAAGENDLIGLGPQQPGHLCPARSTALWVTLP